MNFLAGQTKLGSIVSQPVSNSQGVDNAIFLFKWSVISIKWANWILLWTCYWNIYFVLTKHFRWNPLHENWLVCVILKNAGESWELKRNLPIELFTDSDRMRICFQLPYLLSTCEIWANMETFWENLKKATFHMNSGRSILKVSQTKPFLAFYHVFTYLPNPNPLKKTPVVGTWFWHSPVTLFLKIKFAQFWQFPAICFVRVIIN